MQATLEENPELAAFEPANVSVQDQRPKPELKTHVRPKEKGDTSSKGHCKRWYGDDTFVPTKVKYLRQLLATRLPADAKADIQLKRLDTIEFCDETVAKMTGRPYGTNSGRGTYVGSFKPDGDTGGDVFVLRVEGTINGTAFDVSRAFTYSDLIINGMELPPENAGYRQRVKMVFGEVADELAAIAFPK